MKIARSVIKKSVIFFVISMLAILSACESKANITSKDVPEKNRISTPTDRVIYTDEELQEESSIIAKVQVMDELSSKNSLTDYSEEYKMVTRFCSVRSVRILELIKGDGELSVGDEIQVQEDCAIYEADGEYFQETMDDILPLQKGQTYILYIDDGGATMNGKPAILNIR